MYGDIVYNNVPKFQACKIIIVNELAMDNSCSAGYSSNLV